MKSICKYVHSLSNSFRMGACGPLILTAILYFVPLRRIVADERLDFKTLYYEEDNDRMRIIAPTVAFEKELSPDMTIRLEGIFNSISGASPTGAPPSPQIITQTTTTPNPTPSPSPSPSPGGGGGGEPDEDEESDDEIGDRMLSSIAYPVLTKNFLPTGIFPKRYFPYKAGATPAPTPAPSPSPAPSPGGGGNSGGSTSQTTTTVVPGTIVPKANVDDTRWGLNMELSKRFEQHTLSAMLSLSLESDYQSQGIALKDAIDFNNKNTTLLLGVAGNYDLVDSPYVSSTQDKQTYDFMVGLTQLLDRNTFITLNYSLGFAQGFLNDPYKVTELNGIIVPEHRPDQRDKQIVYLGLNHYFVPLRGAAELGFRRYDDSFGVGADTISLAWFQKIGDHWMLRPSLRWYDQNAADFYDVQFTGTPIDYSSDYRISALQSTCYGLKVIWMPTDKLNLDLSVERYAQKGTDGVTPEDAYPSATIIMAGIHLWF